MGMYLQLEIIFVVSLIALFDVSTSYDYLTMAQQWPPTYCMSKKNTGEACTVSPIPDQFKIHGLWPSNKNGNDPYDCNRKNKLQNNFPANMVTDLDREWPNLSGVNFDFWSYEWRQHGTCCVNTFKNSLQYFNNALGIKKRNKLVDILAGGKILPGATDIDKGSVEAAIEKITKKIPELACYRDPQQQLKPYLLEIRLCVNNTGDYIDCPRASNCPSKMYWPV